MTSPKQTVRRYFLNLFFALIAIFLVGKLTTFGWQSVFEKPFSGIKDDRTIADRLRITVSELVEGIGPRDSWEAKRKMAAYLIQRVKALGYEVEEHSYIVNNKEYKNILARISGVSREEVILVGAHYDTCIGPGADDNASGIAGVLELARLLKDKPFIKDVVFVFFVNEEPPFFDTKMMGSRVFSSAARREGMRIKGAVILESIGYFSDRAFSQKYLPLLGPFYPNAGNFIAVISDLSSRSFYQEIMSGLREGPGVIVKGLVAPASIEGINFSDHASFWREGYSAVMVTDTAFLRNKHYHKWSDTAETLDYRRMALVVLGLEKALVSLLR